MTRSNILEAWIGAFARLDTHDALNLRATAQLLYKHINGLSHDGLERPRSTYTDYLSRKGQHHTNRGSNTGERTSSRTRPMYRVKQ